MHISSKSGRKLFARNEPPDLRNRGEALLVRIKLDSISDLPHVLAHSNSTNRCCRRELTLLEQRSAASRWSSSSTSCKSP